MTALFLAHRGVTRPGATFAVSLVGVIAGDNSLFYLGRRFGTGLVTYLLIGRQRQQHQIDRLKDFMERHGHMAIFYARFLFGVRALVYLTAGSLGVTPARFSSTTCSARSFRFPLWCPSAISSDRRSSC